MDGCIVVNMDLFKLIPLFICSLPSVIYVMFSSRLLEIEIIKRPTYRPIYLSIVI